MKDKICTKCGDGYPATTEYFYFRSTHQRLEGQCKRCVIARVKQYEKNHKKEHKANHTIHQREYRRTVRGYLCVVIENIKKRCYILQDPGYKNYGARGIKLKFTGNELFNWCTKNSIDPRDKQIHRKNNDGHYEFGNIIFKTVKEHRQLHTAGRRQN